MEALFLEKKGILISPETKVILTFVISKFSQGVLRKSPGKFHYDDH